MSGTTAWTQAGPIYVPEVEYKELPEGFYTKPLRGNAFVWAVFSPTDECAGWMQRTQRPLT